MKLLNFVPPFIKAIVGVVAFILGLGWGAYAAVQAISHAEAQDVLQTVDKVRSADMQHINGRFDRTDQKLDAILQELKK